MVANENIDESPLARRPLPRAPRDRNVTHMGTKWVILNWSTSELLAPEGLAPRVVLDQSEIRNTVNNQLIVQGNL